jgi:hypothetical protein
MPGDDGMQRLASPHPTALVNALKVGVRFGTQTFVIERSVWFGAQVLLGVTGPGHGHDLSHEGHNT